MSKLTIGLAIGIAAASIVSTCVLANRRRKQQRNVLDEPAELDLALAS